MRDREQDDIWSDGELGGRAREAAARQSPGLLIVEDDHRFADTLAEEFRDRGYYVEHVNAIEPLYDLDLAGIGYAVVDLRLRQDSGLDAIAVIRERSPQTRVVILTGYASIATAVQAVKQGAVDYLTKPVDIDELERALLMGGLDTSNIPEEFQSLDRHQREYIEYVLARCGGNISEAARRLGIHRQSLQRKLRKFTPPT
ncbi:MAG: response regulator [Deltaproteobacteria bacterium]|nr:response regulator [Deltaproteobacteria bacterium]MBW2418809.1 response regulator [Deltaproteobacteria bacterium]